MTDAEAAHFAEQLEAKLVNDSPEEIIGGLARLVLMREEFKSPEIYRAVMRTMAVKLAAKLLRTP